MSDEDGLVVNDLRFSRDREAMILSTSRSMNILSSRTFKRICTINRPSDMGDILSRSSLCCSVDLSRARIQLWNSSSSPRMIGDEIEINTRGLPILNIMFNPRRLLVLTANSLYIFEIVTMKLLEVVERGTMDPHKYSSSLSLLTTTFSHSNGLCAIVVEKGDVLVIDTYTLFRHQLFTAHTSPISSLEFSLDGQFLATASTKGTLVRLFKSDSHRMDLVCILRRGRSESPITSILFDDQTQSVTVSGETDTAHIYAVPKTIPVITPVVGSAYQTFMSIFPKQYKEAVEAVRDYAHVRLRRTNKTDKFFACVVEKNAVIVLSLVADSSAFAFGYTMDASGGECKLRSEHSLTFVDIAAETGVVAGTPTTTNGEVTGDELSFQKTVQVVLRENPPPTTLDILSPEDVTTKKPKKKKPKKKPPPSPGNVSVKDIFDASD